MAMLCGSISGVAICLKSEEADADGAVVAPDEDDGFDADELVGATDGGGGGGRAESMGFGHIFGILE